jgi:hypothetical protein
MTQARKAVLTIGFDPVFLDFNSPELAPMQLTKEKVYAGVKAEIARLNDLGYDAQSVLVDLGETAESVIRQRLADKSFDCVLIGAGVRSSPKHMLLFEKIINLVHEAAPRARICFNTRPTDTVEAIQRWT